MLKRSVIVATLALCLVSQATAQTSGNRLTLEGYLDYETVDDPRLSPDGSRVVYTRQWFDKLADRQQSSALDRERRRHAQSLSDRWLECSLVSLGRPVGIRRAWRAQGATSIRTLDGCRRVRHSNHPRRPIPFQRRMVSGRHQDSFHHVGRKEERVAHRSADAAPRSQVDRVPQDHRAARIPPGWYRLYRYRVPSHLRRCRGRRHTAADHFGRLRPPRERPYCERQSGLDAG